MKASLIAAAAVLRDHVSVGEMLNVDNLCILLVDGLLVGKIVNGGLKDLRAHSDTCYSKCPVAAL